MMRFAVLLMGFLAAFGFARGAGAQEQAWLQIEAQPSLAGAEERAQAYAALFPDTAGFQLNSGWYAVVLGPYSPAAAAGQLVSLKRENLIPADSFISDGAAHIQQFWPIGASVPELVPELVPVEPVADPAIAAVPELAPELAPEPDETASEARRGEAALDRDAREDLQEALRWYGFYTSAIDGAFGPGTRTSMAAWQSAGGFEPTGVLTSRQRATLISNFAADQAEFGFETVTEAEAGIEITLPMSLVAFDHYEPPFVHFNAKGGSNLRVILISEPGDSATLAGLYDVLQTLAVVPANGARQLDAQSFTISGVGDSVESYAYAAAKGGQIKGYMVIWNPGDAARMARILPVLQASFRPAGDKALDPGLVALDAGTRAGLLAGLEVRRPIASASGFFLDASGRVLTTAATVASCREITIEGSIPATVAFTDVAGGYAVLTPQTPVAPPAVAQFQNAAPRVGAGIMVSGYSYGEKLSAPVLTFGTFEADSGLAGEPGIGRLAAPVLPGDVGGPVVDKSGAVLGMLLPDALGAARTLPEGVAFFASGTAILARLAAAGITPASAARSDVATPDALNAAALGMTVLVSCWE